jgi:hypothetical protein
LVSRTVSEVGGNGIAYDGGTNSRPHPWVSIPPAYLPPHLPLVADCFHVNWDVNSEDEDGVVSALLQRDQAPRVRFQMPILSLQKAITFIDEEYPAL